MFLSAVGVLVVVPWCGHCDVRVFGLGGIFRCRDAAAFVIALAPMKCWYSSIGASAPPYMRETFQCGDFRRWISLCLVVVWMA